LKAPQDPPHSVSQPEKVKKVAELPDGELACRLRCGELLLDLAPFVARLRSELPRLAFELARLYKDFEVLPPDTFADFHIEVRREAGLRRWFRPQARFFYDDKPSFQALPVHHALPMVEWGLNWCVASHAHQYLVVHAAVLAQGDHALLMPAPPGAGKSTLCAALMLSGWRLLSDELGLLDMKTRQIWGMARPLNLKNQSIDIIRQFAPSAEFSDPVPDTTKGLVALLKPGSDSVARRQQPAQVRWVVLPRYQPQAAPRLSRMDRAEAVMVMAEQSFNYHIHGEQGFDALVHLCRISECFKFEYSQLDEGVKAINAMAAAS